MSKSKRPTIVVDVKELKEAEARFREAFNKHGIEELMSSPNRTEAAMDEFIGRMAKVFSDTFKKTDG